LRRISVLVAALTGLLLSGTAQTAPTRCPEHFAGGQAPDVLSAPLARDSYPLCFLGYGNLAPSVSRAGLYSPSHLRAANARGVVRENVFREEKQLPAQARARLKDYVRSGYDLCL